MSSESDPLVAGANIYAVAGVQLPWHLATEKRRWVSLTIYVGFSVLASGPLQSWPTLEPVLVDMGVFQGGNQKSRLAEVYSIAQGFSMASALFAGILFDRVGPRVICVYASLACGLLMAGLVVSISNPALNDLLYVVYPCLTVAANMQNYGVYGWLWLLPESQNTINGIAGALFALGDTLVILLVILHNYCGVTLTTSFGGCAVVCLVTAGVCHLTVPSRELHVGCAHAVVSAQRRERMTLSGLSYGSETERGQVGHREEATQKRDGDQNHTQNNVTEENTRQEMAAVRCIGFAEEWTNLELVWTVMYRMYFVPNLVFLAWAVLLYIFVLYPSVEMYSYYAALLPNDATRLVDLYAVIYGTLGAISAFGFGMLSDRLPFVDTVLYCNVSVVVFLVTLVMRSFVAQVVAQLALTLLVNVFIILACRFALQYAPPELFGTFSGLQMLLLALSQLVMTPLLPLLSDFVYQDSASKTKSVGEYRFGFTLTGILSLATGAIAYVYWRRTPVSQVGSITIQQVKSIHEDSKAESSAPEDYTAVFEGIDFGSPRGRLVAVHPEEATL